MKVCTDACIFGAYISETIRNGELEISNRFLDIGAGTGLLSLMVAQKNNCIIDAIEIDELAFKQAKENFAASPWKDRLNIFNSDILFFENNKKYDCIISNPPFFENDLQSDNISKNKAKHHVTLTLKQLISAIDRLLATDGFFAVLLPFHRVDYFEKEIVKFNFHLAKKLLIKQTPKHNFFRAISVFSRKKNQEKTDKLIIKDENGKYTNEFKKLLKDYYLYL